jgi:hypothetical protein
MLAFVGIKEIRFNRHCHEIAFPIVGPAGKTASEPSRARAVFLPGEFVSAVRADIVERTYYAVLATPNQNRVRIHVEFAHEIVAVSRDAIDRPDVAPELPEDFGRSCAS